MKARNVTLIILLALCSACTGQRASGSAGPVEPAIDGDTCLEEGCLAPNFSLATTQDEQIELHELRGHSVMLNFWATWCSYCRNEMPAIQRMHDTYLVDGLVVLAVNVQEPPTTATDFASENGYTFPVLLDRKGEVAEQYAVNGLPTTYFLDADLIIRKVQLGGMPLDFMENILMGTLGLGVETAEAVVAATPLPQLTDTPTPLPRTVTVRGCVNVDSLIVRAGPGKQFEMIDSLFEGNCRRFDARTADGIWVRMAERTGPNGERMWVMAQYLWFETPMDALPVAE